MAKALQFLRSDLRSFATKQGRYGLFSRTLKKCVDQVPQSRSPGDIARNRGDVDVAQAIFFVPDVPFFLEHAELSPHGRVMLIARHAIENLGDGGALEFVEDVHDLAFTA
jgi:hypothetical protein